MENIADNLTNIKDQRLNMTGSVSLGSQFYEAGGIAPRRDAFQWSARAALNLSFLGISAPFSYTFSDANKNFNLPSYTFAGISPTYKWATLHAGDRSMAFSKYTMSGISFRGVGFELRPGNWRIASFYGRLNRALASDLDAVGSLNGFYERKGYGLQVGHTGKSYSYDIQLFSANDEEDVNQTTNLGQALAPINNKVISVKGRQQLSPKVAVSGELAHSVFNEDKTLNDLPTGEMNVANRMLGLFTPTESLLTGQAVNLQAFYNAKSFGLRAGYERITKDFRTIGALFFNNDTENITAGINRNFFKNKMNVFLNGGLERTNLGQVDLETTNRIIGSANISYRPDPKHTLSLAYSNFRNDTKLRAQTEVLTPVDSIFLAQVNQNANFMVTRRLGKKGSPSTLSLVLSHQRANSIVNDAVLDDNRSRFTTAALSFTGGRGESKLRYNVGLTFNYTQVGVAINTTTLAPSAGLTKSFFNNALSTFARTSMSFVSRPGDMNAVWNVGTGANYRLKNSHRIGLTANFLNRFGAEQESRNFREVYGQLNYGYSFGGSLGLRRRDRTATEVVPTQ